MPVKTWTKNNKRLEVLRGNIVQQKVDALVNAANQHLAGGGGVDGAIHRAAGPRLMDECRSLPTLERGIRCSVGSAVLTGAHDLPHKGIIHAVGPQWTGGHADERRLLAEAHRSAMKLAFEQGFESIAFPALSCGAFRFPVKVAAKIALETIVEELSLEHSVRLVRYVLLLAKDVSVFQQACENLAP